ncbi:hypothetical protein [Polyangium mundeleinium]|uniref:Uncharacterized protein n=1 Tax=Polyangium mundeleinium TaxID=2995306 RepID=A0ABT5F6Q3_9BACT|nr:hypothetical protein [Polyangium mundeleinium]MDC0749152.1 hypothetical protein [Polyangium mundeleinium]
MSGKDVAVVVLLIVGFASFVTTHVWLAGRLILRGSSRLRGMLALVVPPLAPVWGYRQGFRKGAALWVVALVTYVTARVVAFFA